MTDQETHPLAPPHVTSLAEGRWLWRRLFVFTVSLGVWLLLERAIVRAEAAGLPRLAEGLMDLLALVLVLYLVAPTAQQIIAVLADLKLRLGGRP